MQPPKVIFLDAVGTLFGVRGSVGQVYSQLAQQWGVNVSESAVNAAFGESFRHTQPPAFPGADPAEIPLLEFEWWQAIARQTFDRAGVLQEFVDFATFFKALYAYFETAEPWFVYPDVPSMLATWRSQGIQLGILSNFDTRLYSVLHVLNLADYFDSVTLSTEVGAAKPSLQIFETGLKKHNCLANSAWHIGDSYSEDYAAAQTAGLQGIWLNRSDQSVPTRTNQSTSFSQLGDDRTSPLTISTLTDAMSLLS